ncbi:hypothetical protein HELRODRAFT_71264, partial [Helobdella robusta]|uniref:ATP synthase subunit b n=1 Tax=Helobdella robusta TaxID=6412 RepID=T1G0I5_HELRO
NFPVLRRPETCPPTRLGFIPEAWFQALYDKTGVTGPYVFGFGFITYLLSKEIVIVEHQFSHFLAFWLAFYWLHRKFGDRIAKALDKKTEHLDEKMFLKPLRDTRESSEKVIKDLEKTIWQEGGQKYIFDAKRENIDLQLESAYRQRLAEVHQGVKRRLDYHMEVENLHKTVEQKHMVNWIVSNVIKGITPQQEKDSMLKCIADLKALAQKQKAAPAV